MIIKNISDFDISSKSHTGGVTGSARVKEVSDGSYYQLKPSILDNPNMLRRMKAGYTDRENFGEVIASFIGRALLPAHEVPLVSLVYDEHKKRMYVASKYLSGEQVRTLDDYAKEQGVIFPKGKKHAVFVNDNPTSAEELSLKSPGVSHLKASLARALVVSAIVGDHDVNPGNMLVVTNDKVDYVARIDFGHALNDLLNVSKLNGGGMNDENNPILDFFNRSKVAGVGGDPSKLWRDYPGMVPSQEIVDALKQMSIEFSNNAQRGIIDARQHFMDAINTLKEKGDVETIDHIQKSLVAIGENISGTKIHVEGVDADETLYEVFSKVERFVDKNGDNLLKVANIMQVQLDIEHALTTDGSFSEGFQSLLQQNNFPSKDGIIQWVKTSNSPAFTGTIEAYLVHRVSQLTADKGVDSHLITTNYRNLRENVKFKSVETDASSTYKHRYQELSQLEAFKKIDSSDLVNKLQAYIDERVVQKNIKSAWGGGYTKNEKIQAATALIEGLKGETVGDLTKHSGALKNGDLSKIITDFIDANTQLKTTSNTKKIDLLLTAVADKRLQDAPVEVSSSRLS